MKKQQKHKEQEIYETHKIALPSPFLSFFKQYNQVNNVIISYFSGMVNFLFLLWVILFLSCLSLCFTWVFEETGVYGGLLESAVCITLVRE